MLARVRRSGVRLCVTALVDMVQDCKTAGAFQQAARTSSFLLARQ